MTEADTCREFVTPKPVEAGWGAAETVIGEQHSFTNGRIIVAGGKVRRGKQRRADYLLYYRRDFPLAVVEAHLDAVERDAAHLLALRFRNVIANAPLRPMAEVAPLVRREVSIDLEQSYTELGVRSFYKGTFHRRTVPGSHFPWQDLYRIQAGNLVFSNIMAWEQAIAIAMPEDDGCVGNHRMLTCEANSEVAVPGFLWYCFTTEEGFAKICAASPGTAARNRTITAPAFMAIDVPVPLLAAQQTFNRLQTEIGVLKARHAAIRQANAALIPATLERVFAGNP